MNNLEKDYRLYARSNFNVPSTVMDDYLRVENNKGYIEPYILEERNLNVTQMSVFSRLFAERILFLGTEIDSDTANIINSQLMFLNSIGDEDIKLYINSPGGSVTDGLAIYDIMNFIKPDVSTCCMGMCASMASVLLSSGTKGKRLSLPHGEIMIHQVSGGTGRAQNADVKIIAQQLQKSQDTLYKILAKNTGKTLDEIENDADRDYWMTPEEAMAYGNNGLIDKIIENE